jgi:hypothetical protein
MNSDALSAVKIFEEMSKRGVFSPATHQEPFEMPTMLRSVPTFTTYSTPATPVNMGTNDARLEERSPGDRG